MAIFGTPPSDYYSRQDQNKAQKFRDIMNLFMTFQQNKTQKEQFGISKDLQSRGLDIREREAKSLEGYRTRPPDPTALMQDLQNIQRLYDVGPDEAMRIYQEKGGPSAFKEKVTYGTEVLDMDPLAAGIFGGASEGRAPVKTPAQIYADSKARQEGTEAGKPQEAPVLGYEGPKGSPQRNAWIKTVDRFYKEMADDKVPTDPKKYLEKTFEFDPTTDARPITPSGLYLDMPRKYNYALFARDNKVATAEDLDTIRRYDDMFRLFSEFLLPRYETFKEFMKADLSRDSDIDLHQIKFLYDTYGK